MPSAKLFENIHKDWKKQKLFVLEELLERLDCSVITVRRRLKEWNAISSYNKNGRYYTLSNIAKFDTNGLWFYRDVGFSKNGNLTQTIIELINNSTAGLSGEDISDILRFNSYSILAKIIKKSPLIREKIFGKFIYFSVNQELYNRQVYERDKINEQLSVEMIPDTIGVMALVEFIQNPKLDIPAISHRLNSKGINITAALLYNFFKYHGILKKTQDFRL